MIQFVNKIAVNIEAKTPKDNVTENPFIGPEPNINSNKAAINVVMFASNIVEIALE